MVKVRILASETITDEKRGGERYEVYIIELRHGMKSWNLRRKYKAFCTLDMLLRQKFPNEKGLSGLPTDAAGHERELIKEFIEKVTSSSFLMKTSEARQFFEIPDSRRLMDLSEDGTRSIFSLPLKDIPGLRIFPPNFPEITIAHCILILVLLASAAPISGIIPGFPPILRPIIAGLNLVICCWQIVQPRGIIDFILGSTFGAENIGHARAIVRPADMSLLWMMFGMILGLGLGLSPLNSPQSLSLIYMTGLICILAIGNMIFTLIQIEKQKLL